MDLPTLDFGKFNDGTTAERLQLSHDLVDSFQKHGFVKLKHHGIPQADVAKLLGLAKTMFALPLEEKLKFENEKGPKPQRGFSRTGAEVTAVLREKNLTNGLSGYDLKDEREFYDVGPPGDSQFANKFPASVPAFRPFMEKAYERLQTVSLEIIRAIEVGLQLPEGTLTDRCHPAHSELRLNHYPATDLRQLCDGKTKRTWPHTDFGIITLLFQDDVGGLELEDRSSEAEKFVPVHSDSYGDEAEMVVNISDTLERWTNGVIRAGVHRVDVPVQLKDKQEGVCPDRYSGIFFMKASRATSVGPLPAFVSESRPAIFDDLTALEYQKIKTAQLY